VQRREVARARIGDVRLVKDEQLGTWSAPISRSTSRTALIWSSASSLAPSTTCTKQVRELDGLERAHERLDEFVGQVEMKPTVSVNNTVSPREVDVGACVDQGHEQSFSARTSASVSALSIEDLPALV